MMAVKAPIYKEKHDLGNRALLDQLKEAISELESKMRADVSITKGGSEIGWGVNKAQRGIAADNVVSITRAIKSLKGW